MGLIDAFAPFSVVGRWAQALYPCTGIFLAKAGCVFYICSFRGRARVSKPVKAVRPAAARLPVQARHAWAVAVRKKPVSNLSRRAAPVFETLPWARGAKGDIRPEMTSQALGKIESAPGNGCASEAWTPNILRPIGPTQGKGAQRLNWKLLRELAGIGAARHWKD